MVSECISLSCVNVVSNCGIGGPPTTRLRLQNIASFSIAPSGPPYRIAAYVPGSKVTYFSCLINHPS